MSEDTIPFSTLNAARVRMAEAMIRMEDADNPEDYAKAERDYRHACHTISVLTTDQE